MQTRIIKAAVLAASFSLMGGCATITPEQFAAVESMAKSAAEDANSAMGTANNALAVANEANYTATEAQKTAEMALNCCNENSTKLDRMFQKAMMK